MSRTSKSIETESRITVSRGGAWDGGGREGEWGMTTNWYRVSFGKIKLF